MLPFQRLLLSSQLASLAVLGLLPRLQHPAWLVSPQLQLQLPCCASGRRHAEVGGAPSPWPLFSLLHQLTAKYPWGLVREGFSLIFFPMEIIPPLVRGISACISLGGLTSSLPFFPSILDAHQVGSFVSLAVLCWPGLPRRVVWVTEPKVGYLGPDCHHHWLCDFQDGPCPLWAPWSFIYPVLG